MSKNNKKHKKKSPKPKREKITWVDDGSTVADMSGVGRRGGHGRGSNPNHTPPPPRNKNGKPYSRFRAIVTTYFDAVKMMLLPMLVVIGILCVVFLLLYVAMGVVA